MEAWPEALSSPVITELAPGRVWEVATERGDRYVLKKVSTFNAPDPVRRFTDEARILTHLLQRGVPVAVPVLSNDGRACTTDDEGAPHALFPMLPKGDPDNDPGLDPALFQNVGAAIARLHVALADCPFGIDSWEVRPGELSVMWQTVEDRLPAEAVTELSTRIRPRWDSIGQALSASPQRVHGDVHGANLLTDGQQVTGIIDCDHLPLAPRGFDLGYYLAFGVHWRLAGNQPSQPVEEATPFIARHLVAGYDAVSRLTRRESDDLPALALFAALGLISFFVQEHDLVEESWLRTAHWISDNFGALRVPASASGG
jgi:Ser/Thr protein kinase RdoA (MazF antagonist)